MRYPPCCKINLETLFKIVILVCFSALFVTLVVTNRISIYLHPRLIPFVIFAAMTFLLMAYSLVQDLKRKRRRFAVAPYLIFLLPLILAVAAPPAAMSGATLQYSGTNSTGMTSGPGEAPAGPAALPQLPESAEDDAPASGAPQQESPQLQPNQEAVDSKTPFGGTVILTITDKTLDIDDTNFVSWLGELDGDPGRFKGMHISYVGYVYKSDMFAANEFVAGRNLMWCCAADIQLIGCLCRYEGAAELTDGSWVRVDGTLDTAVWQGSEIPLISELTVTPAEKPAVEYVYPSY